MLPRLLKCLHVSHPWAEITLFHIKLLRSGPELFQTEQNSQRPQKPGNLAKNQEKGWENRG